MLVLMLMPSSIAAEFKIKVEGDKKTTVYVKETDTVSTVKEKILSNLIDEIENERTKIINKKLIGTEKRSAELKAKLEEKNKILTTRKTLRLDKNGSPLEDRKTMKECGIVKKGATVFLALEGFEIFVYYKGKTYTIWGNDKDTVYELKKSIEKVIGLRPSNQKLAFPSLDDVLNDATKTMHYYNIGKGASLLLGREFQIGCQYNDNEYFPIVEETEKVSSVKEKVKEKIQKKSGIQLKIITLAYDGKVLEDNAEIGSFKGIGRKAAIVYVCES
ncbi:hypothetical protein niasHS_018058 [Heterodera schachtii]|uniref:Ubiquitin-like domain-containing protein n=2 Tax=Heterodera TaxID=34509 RepID=A0ABD2I855_HETSC